jgi:hypothetical protein
MITISTTTNNDIHRDASGNLALVRNLPAVLQTAEHLAYTLAGEMVLALTQGVPFWPTAFGATPNIAQFEAFLAERIKECPDVVEVQDLSAQQVSDRLLYTATIITIYGEGVIGNGV